MNPITFSCWTRMLNYESYNASNAFYCWPRILKNGVRPEDYIYLSI